MLIGTKIKGSTLFEVVIATVISAIVVGIAFSGWNIISKQFKSFEEHYQEITTMQKLDRRLRIDFQRAQTVNWNTSKNELNIFQPSDTIMYTFDNNQIVRNEKVIMENLEKITPFFEGKEQTNGLIDAIKIDFSKDRNILSVFISRTVSAKEKMDLEWEE